MVEVVRSTIIDAPVARVWAVLRDFNGHRDWHPAIAASVIEDGKAGDQVGAVRRFRLRDGAELREQLLSLSDRDRSLTYCILSAPLPLYGYIATLRLRPVTDGTRCFWTWASRFDTPSGREAELADVVGRDIYEAGFAAIRRLLAGPGYRAAPVVPPGPLRSRAMVMAGAMLVPAEVEVPPPGPGEVRIRHRAIGVNFHDIQVRRGEARPPEPPGIPGMEAAGEVLDIGPGVHGMAPGDRVAYATYPLGAYAETRVIAADRLVRIPQGITDYVAAAGLLKGMTAEMLVRRVRPLRAGEHVLVRAAAGGVGALLCQWAAHLGATVIGSVGSASKLDAVRNLGCAYLIDEGTTDLAAAIRDITRGQGVDVVYDGIGGPGLPDLVRLLARRGMLVNYGRAGGAAVPLDPGSFAERSAQFARPALSHYTGAAEDLRASATEVFDLIGRGILKVAIHREYPLAEAAAAHRAIEARMATGACVLIP